MKMTFMLLCLLAAEASPLWAQKAGDLGVGIVVGNPSGLTTKLWLYQSQALDAGVGFDKNVILYSDYLWYFWKALPRPSTSRLSLHLGAGVQLTPAVSEGFGARAPAGLAYWPSGRVEIFLEAVPVFQLHPRGRVPVSTGAGLRYYFSVG